MTEVKRKIGTPFDRRMMIWCRKRYGVLGDDLWMGNMPQIDDLRGRAYDEYCGKVWDAVDLDDSTKAWHLWDVSSGFWDKGWQEKWRSRQYQLIKDQVEEHAIGAVEIEVVNFDG